MENGGAGRTDSIARGAAAGFGGGTGIVSDLMLMHGRLVPFRPCQWMKLLTWELIRMVAVWLSW